MRKRKKKEKYITLRFLIIAIITLMIVMLVTAYLLAKVK